MNKLSPEMELALEGVRRAARARHERAREEAARRGRRDFPLLPYECSWTFGEEFGRKWPKRIRRPNG